ncbi:MAG: M56 family metallopeptidase [Verrucomicrobiota bacterium]
MKTLFLGTVPFSGAMELFFHTALQSMMVLGAAIVTVRLMRRSSSAARHLVLFGAILSLLIVPVSSALLPAWHVLPRWMDASYSSKLMQPSGEPLLLPGPAFKPVEKKSTPSGNRQVAVPSVSRAPSWQWGWMLWLAGIFVAALPAAGGIFSLWRLERSARKITAGPAWQLVRELQGGRDILLLQSNQRRMPMTWGLFRPRLLLPADAEDWSRERREVVLRHELAHIARRDYAANLLTELVCALYWFNPLVWITARRLKMEREQACDDMVLKAGVRPTLYAEEVLQIAAQFPLSRLAACGAVAMASTLEGRLLAILDGKRNRGTVNRPLAAAVSGTLAIILVFSSMLRAAPPSGRGVLPASRTPGPIAWWRAEGDGNDRAGGHDGQFPFGTRFLRGPWGNAFDFRRSHAIENQLQRVSIPDSRDFELSDEFTLEAWIRPLNYGGIVLFRGDDRGGFDHWQLDLRTEGNLTFSFNTARNEAAGVSTPIQLYQWQHVAATFHHGTMKLYINSVPVAEAKTALRPVTVLDPSANPALGIGNTGGTNYNIPFDGLIDEVRIYNHALSGEEIAEALRR